MFSIFSHFGQFLYDLTLKYGVIGLGIGTFFESFGVPVAAVVLDLAAGPLIVTGRTNFLTALVVAVTGLALGSLASYYVGYAGAKAYGRWRPKKVDEIRSSRAKDLLTRYGAIAILFAQFFGPARTWISIPAGAMRLDIKKFILFTVVGGTIYCSAAIGLSLVFTRIIKAEIGHVLMFVSLPVLVSLMAVVAALIILWWYRRRVKSAGKAI